MRLCVAAVVAVPAAFAMAAPPTFLVLAEGDAAPTVPEATVQSISNFTTNNVGQVAMRVLMPQGVGGVTGTTANMLLRYSVANGLERIARSGTAAPVQPGELFGSTFNWAGGQCMNDAGNVVFRSSINSAANLCIDGTSTPVVNGMMAPGLPGLIMSNYSATSVHFARLSNQGHVLFTGGLTGTGVAQSNDSAIFFQNALIAREGDPAPGTALTFGSFGGVNDAFINAAGKVAFGAGLQGGTAATNEAVYSYASGVLTLEAHEGDAAPGLAGQIFGSLGFGAVHVSSQGHVSFITELGSGTNVIYVNGVPVVKDGDAAPGYPGLTLYDLGATLQVGSFAISDTGEPFYFARLSGTGANAANRDALFLGQRRIARRASPAPIADLTWQAFYNDTLRVNDAGQAIFVADLAGPGVTTANDLGIFAWNGYSVSLLVREGDVVAGRTIVDLAGPGPSVRLNNNGEVFFLAALNAGQTGLLRTNIPCTADMDNGTDTGTPDGGVTIDDLLYYISVFGAGANAADLDDGTGAGLPDGGVTIDDLIFFLIHFFNGC